MAVFDFEIKMATSVSEELASLVIISPNPADEFIMISWSGSHKDTRSGFVE